MAEAERIDLTEFVVAALRAAASEKQAQERDDQIERVWPSAPASADRANIEASTDKAVQAGAKEQQRLRPGHQSASSSERSQEPVAWMEYDRDGRAIGATTFKPDGFWPFKPLYLAPDSATSAQLDGQGFPIIEPATWNAAIERCSKLADEEWIGANSLGGSKSARRIADRIRDMKILSKNEVMARSEGRDA